MLSHYTRTLTTVLANITFNTCRVNSLHRLMKLSRDNLHQKRFGCALSSIAILTNFYLARQLCAPVM